ncbi:MAG: F0F1 ATP synthase subunit B [Proteobacteria bacterium]|nr:F0F1 ATP synthase subunit B [Pseudomonadota bacterium]
MSRGKRLARPALAVLCLFAVLAAFLSFSTPVLASGHGSETTMEKAEHAEEPEHGSFTSAKLWNLLYRALNFLALAILLTLVLRKPLAQFLSDRRRNIAETLDDLERKKVEAAERFKQIEAKLNALEGERDKIMGEYMAEGEEEKRKIIAHANQMAERIKQQAEMSISQEIKKAKDELTREIAEMSAAMAEDMIRKNINDKDQQRLVEEYLEKVVQH